MASSDELSLEPREWDPAPIEKLIPALVSGKALLLHGFTTAAGRFSGGTWKSALTLPNQQAESGLFHS
jgi:hypothetical protein